MSLIERAKQDIEVITSNSAEFGVRLKFMAPDGTTATIYGLSTRIHMAVDTDGTMVNSRKVHVSFAERNLTDHNYPLRNARNEVDLKGHKVTKTESDGTERTYIVKEWFPDETVGLIPVILEEYAG